MGFKKRSKVNAEFNMSSLTDIIFLLLIFFMLTSTLVNSNPKNIDVPAANSKTPTPQTFSLSIDQTGAYFIDKEEVDYNSLERKLRARIREFEQESGMQTEEITIVLNAAKTVSTGTIVDAINLANQLGVKLIMSTSPK